MWRALDELEARDARGEAMLTQVRIVTPRYSQSTQAPLPTSNEGVIGSVSPN
jgi:hypothetical protein